MNKWIGPDRADIEVDVNDEITTHESMRYVSSTEAIWRNFGFELHWSSHAVEVLPVHLPGKQAVHWCENDAPEAIRARGASTKLTQFFKLCREHRHEPAVANLKYIDVVDHFVWNKSKRDWTQRKHQTKIIGRIHTVSPKDFERHALRILLHHKECPKSFEDLRTVDGIVYPTFKEACIKLGLLASDAEWDRCLSEAANFAMPGSFRNLFCVILRNCNPTDVAKLWRDYYEHLSHDHHYRLSNDPAYQNDQESMNTQVLIFTLLDIDRCLLSMGSSLIEYVTAGMLPSIPPTFNGPQTLSDNPLLAEELKFAHFHKSELQKIMEQLQTATIEHKDFYDKVNAAIEDPTKNNMFFLEGEGGSGKTFICQILLAHHRLEGNVAIAVASSGLAALLMMGGHTAHNRFKISITPPTETMSCTYNVKSDMAEVLSKAKLIIWDEVSMVNRYIVEAVDRMLRDITSCDKPFGGKVTIFSGDFRQLLPVMPGEDEGAAVRAILPRSYLWSSIRANHFRLTTNMRLLLQDLSESDKREMEEFAMFLISLGEGTAQSIDGKVRLPDGIATEYVDESSVTNLVGAIYGDIANSTAYQSWLLQKKMKYFAERALLAPKHDVVTKLNRMVLDMLSSNQREYVSADCVADVSNDAEQHEAAVNFPVEFLNTLEINNFPQHVLRLKVGAVIMLLRNLCPASGLCNGTRLIVTELHHNVIQARILSGIHSEKDVLIPRIDLYSDSNNGWPFALKRRQFPVRLAFAMTIHKCQGQTLKYVSLYLHDPIFSHGQLYVAFSRVTSKKNIHVLLHHGRIDGQDGLWTPNVVLFRHDFS